MADPVKIQCLKCRHTGRLTGSDLVRRGIRPEAPIASFVKRLRCGKCGSQRMRPARTAAAKSWLVRNQSSFGGIEDSDGAGAKAPCPQQAIVPSVQAPVTSRGFHYGGCCDSQS